MSHKRSLNEAMDINEEPYSMQNRSKKQKIDDENVLDDIKGLDENDIENDENVFLKQQLVKSGEPIVLNIGGVKYQTCLSTLTTNTEYFRKYFSGLFSLRPSKDGSYFIDRDGEYFKYILHFLRNNKLCIPNDVHLIDQLLLEVDFYGLSTMKSILLLRKSNSTILKQGEIEYLQSCFNKQYEEGQYKDINLSKSSMIYCGHLYPPYDVVQGLHSLLFIISTFDDHRFGLFMQPSYVRTDTTNGFLFDLNTMHHLVEDGFEPHDIGINILWKNHDEDSNVYQTWLEIRNKENILGDLVPKVEMFEAVIADDMIFNTLLSVEVKHIEVYRIACS